MDFSHHQQYHNGLLPVGWSHWQIGHFPIPRQWSQWTLGSWRRWLRRTEGCPKKPSKRRKKHLFGKIIFIIGYIGINHLDSRDSRDCIDHFFLPFLDHFWAIWEKNQWNRNPCILGHFCRGYKIVTPTMEVFIKRIPLFKNGCATAAFFCRGVLDGRKSQ